jgi:apolipoprotein D and lipocalin family protein
MNQAHATRSNLLTQAQQWAATGLLACLLIGFVGAAQAQIAPLRTVPAVDVPRYMGTWYEIAKYPNWFQKKCTSSTQANYSLQADGRVQVLNRCKTDKGEWSEALGSVRQIGGPTSAQLKVRFAPEWLSFMPWVWGDYWIIDLDPDYQWVVVSEPQREYLWILSRTPEMSAMTYQTLLGKLEVMGFDLKTIELTRP